MVPGSRDISVRTTLELVQPEALPDLTILVLFHARGWVRVERDHNTERRAPTHASEQLVKYIFLVRYTRHCSVRHESSKIFRKYFHKFRRVYVLWVSTSYGCTSTCCVGDKDESRPLQKAFHRFHGRPATGTKNQEGNC